MNNNDINNMFLKLSKRAERNELSKLVSTFVDVGPLITLISSTDNQIIFGRRGTGKTHALLYLSERVKDAGDLSIYVDMRTIGSSGGIYSDEDKPLSERSTRLLLDTLAAIHDALLDFAVNAEPESVNLTQIGPLLDEFASAITDVSVSGVVTREQTSTSASENTNTSRGGLALESASVAVDVSSNSTSFEGTKNSQRIEQSGSLIHRVHFGAIGKALKKITDALSTKRIWILLDEWSVVPLNLQPYLADLIRRSIFPLANITVKIGAIEQRSNFAISMNQGNYIGIELGPDASADANLDDFMVFDNDATRATEFFKELIFKHVKSLVEGQEDELSSADALVSQAFTQKTTLQEFVRASEGVPRDAINVLSLAAQKAYMEPINIIHLRNAARTWYQRDKESAVTSNPRARNLLHWIVDEVIGHRRARAFLLQSNTRNELIDALFDSRVLHLLKRNISAPAQPGSRYDVYKLDYGCYVDLVNTVKAPGGLLFEGIDDIGVDAIEVPQDDYRAIRRAILDIDEFESSPGAR